MVDTLVGCLMWADRAADLEEGRNHTGVAEEKAAQEVAFGQQLAGTSEERPFVGLANTAG